MRFVHFRGRRSPGEGPRLTGPGLFVKLDTAGRRLARLIGAAIGHKYWHLPHPGFHMFASARSQNGPINESWIRMPAFLRRGFRAAASAAAAPLRTLTTITVGDTRIRAVVTRGSQIRCWGSVDLPEGAVRDGAVLDADKFGSSLAALNASLAGRSKPRGRQTAIAITGRNLVLARFTVVKREDVRLEDAVLAVAGQRMSIRPDELELDWHATPRGDTGERPEEQTDPDEIYDVYALGLYRNVVERNVKELISYGAEPVDVKPKALALAAAVNVRQALILDLEPEALSVIVVQGGLPEVVRDLALEPDLPRRQACEVIRSQISLSVGYYDSLNPQTPLGPETPLFVTGAGGADAALVDAALEGVPYPLRRLPRLLAASEEFPYEEYAACVGLAVSAKKRPWQRRRTRVLERPTLRFLPPAFRPRPWPVRTVLAGLAVAGLILGLGVVFDVVGEKRDVLHGRQAVARALDSRIQRRVFQMRQAGTLKEEIETLKLVTTEMVREIEAITGLDRGFGSTLHKVSSLRPPGVSLSVVDDDGSVVVVRASASTYADLLAYARVLSTVPGFDDLRITSLGTVSAPRPERAAKIGAGIAGGMQVAPALDGLRQFPPGEESESDPVDTRMTATFEIKRNGILSY